MDEGTNSNPFSPGISLIGVVEMTSESDLGG